MIIIFEREKQNNIYNILNISPTGSPTSTLCQLHSNYQTKFFLVSLKKKDNKLFLT